MDDLPKRFRVKRVQSLSTSERKNSCGTLSEDDTDDDRRVSSYARSFRHFTREALPRLDNYRNILSIQAIKRPTLDELHGEDLLKKVPPSFQNLELEGGDSVLKFGWIQGVLVRNLLNIWGVMLFLRLSWVVGQTGVPQALLLITSTTVVTLITAVSMSAISTNGEIKGGGTYYMISRSLGPEFGGSIGLIFSVANAVACAMYVVGFCESFNALLDSLGVKIVDGGVQDVRVVGCITMVILTGIVMIGMEWEAKTQLVLLVVLLGAIFDFVIGSFIGPRTEEAKAKGFLGYNLTIFMSNVPSDYRFSEGVHHDFFSVLAIFFPAATGILAGANISGDLKDPQKAIPKGTVLSIFITSVSYMLMAVVCGFTVLRDASGNATHPDCLPGPCPYGLQNDFQIVELVSWVGPVIYAGCFAATLSSALASLVSAPKVFQALCKDKLYPGIEWFGKGYGKTNEPIRGYALTFIIAIAFILIGELNAIAPLISNFFLAAYTLINFSTFHASLAKPVGWRPTFRYYNKWLSLAGSIICVLMMFLISWFTAFVTFAVVLGLYVIVSVRKPNVNWGSSTQAQIYKNALQAAHQLNAVEDHVKNYSPQILVMSGMPSARPSLVDFAHLITKNKSLLLCGHINTSRLQQKIRNVLAVKAQNWLRKYGFKAFYMQMDGQSFEDGCTSLLKASGVGKLRPNVLLLGFKSDWQTCPQQDLHEYFGVLHKALDLHLSVGILRLQDGLDSNEKPEELPHAADTSSDMSDNDDPFPEGELQEVVYVPESAPDASFLFQKPEKRTGTIDVWWLYDDGGLTLLLPYIISTRKHWSSCKLRVFALSNRNEHELEHRNMAALLTKFRIDYSDLQIVTDIRAAPGAAASQLLEDIIGGFQRGEEAGEITEAELLANKDKTNRHLRLRELLVQHSSEAHIVVMTLPIPRKGVVSAALYMAWLEILTRGMPPMLLVRGNQTSVLTFYS